MQYLLTKEELDSLSAKTKRFYRDREAAYCEALIGGLLDLTETLPAFEKRAFVDRVHAADENARKVRDLIQPPLAELIES